MAAQPFDPMAHSQQSDPMGFLKVMLQRDSHPVVANGKFQHPAAQGQRHLHMKCLGMAMHIEQRFLRDPQTAQVQPGRCARLNWGSS